jgi:amino acid adenylation domain-containing protein
MLTHEINLPPEQAAIRARCFHPTGTFEEFPEHEIYQSIAERFEKTVAKYPNRLALKIEDRTVTYGDLNRSANRIAHAILSARGPGNEPIALLFERGIDIVAALLAALKAGKFYAALDRSLPTERLTHLLKDSQATLVVTNTPGHEIIHQLGLDSRQLLNIDELDDSLSNANPGLLLSPATLAYLIYTSGSTGKPKGVEQNHLNLLVEIMAYTNNFHISPEDRLTLLAQYGSGQWLKNAFAALLNGAALFPFDVKSEGVDRLVQHLINEEISLYHSSVTLFRHLVGTLSGNEAFPALRLIRLASQQVLKEDLESYKRHFSRDCILVNALSSSETGTFRWYFMNKETLLSDDSVPVGYALENKTVVLLDEDANEVGFDRVGRIAVKSRYLSPGYWRNPELTKRRFSADASSGEERLYHTGDLGRFLPDGCLVYVGRADFRVKIRGYSVEIAEVENALAAHDEIREAAIAPWEHEPGEQYLAAYVVPSSQPAPAIHDLIRFLRRKLPDYMIPSAFVFLKSLPLNNGKLDRRALPRPENKRPEMKQPCVPPRNKTEAILVEIWEKVLDVRTIGIRDDFFDLGGHSLAATRVVSEIIKTFMLEIPLRSLFERSTIEKMAAVIDAHQAQKLGARDLDRLLAELESLSDEEAQRLLATQSQ